ncbi:MAG: hypothetical protein OXI88_22025 [Gammaproteobacteria bacterium]|nr:hypothetical protein [Gammaproteobacteria bacterium]
MFRATQQRQYGVAALGKDSPFPAGCALSWRCCVAPCGRAGKRSPAALRRLARARHSPHGAPCAQPLPDPLNMVISG